VRRRPEERHGLLAERLLDPVHVERRRQGRRPRAAGRKRCESRSCWRARRGDGGRSDGQRRTSRGPRRSLQAP
jgi:hypothetical protein